MQPAVETPPISVILNLKQNGRQTRTQTESLGGKFKRLNLTPFEFNFSILDIQYNNRNPVPKGLSKSVN